MKWKSPRCSVACWDEIKKHDATLSKALSALVDMRRDRDEWKAQHENLLAMYRAALAATPTSAMREALEEIERTCSTRAASIARAALAAPQAQEGERLPTHGNLLIEINKAAHASGTNAWVRDVLKRAHRAIRDLAPVSRPTRGAQ